MPLHLDYGDTTVLDLWEGSAQRHPDRTALDFLGRASTYAEVDEEVRRVAGGLHALGVRPGDNVALVMPNCPQNVIAFFAVLRLGAAVVEHTHVMQWSELAGSAALDDSHPRPGKDDVALLLYTSGTTGVPKGVPLLHRNLVANVVQGRRPPSWCCSRSPRSA